MKTPLYSKLIEYSRQNISFHMPGHKFDKTDIFKDINLFNLDATEITGLDNLYEAEAVIKDAMDLMASFYGAKETVFLTNGSTAGILASLMTVCNPNDKILVARNCHYSVWNALVLIGAIPIYITPNYYNEYLIGEIDTRSVATALEKHPDVVGLIMVSPTYEGIVSDITQISKLMENKIFIVDEAHGAHFNIHPIFPTSSIALGADIVIHSMHKTLPVLTQGALLHICSNKINSSNLIKNLRLIQTSSPSYLLMANMDYIRNYIQQNKTQIENSYILPLKQLMFKLKSLKNLSILDENISKHDISKIIIFTNTTNLTGYELGKILEIKYKIGIEMATQSYILLISTISDTKESLDILEKILFEIDIHCESTLYSPVTFKYKSELYLPASSPRQIYYSDKYWQDIDLAEDNICAQNIMLYPPGIPLVCLGEIIDKQIIEFIKAHREYLKGIKFENEKIKILVVYKF
ncbi:hypothetical protein AN639_07915 [Candidatus Epulonipiscium fishelsonii]|uniref:Uncharacterized protein n=1 Tax=Candidatus Epulonipiscium fishelsonii TaxID=77094 RepID=A0ACC8X8N1_9FIRM|nr:hypothetical protein AN396_11105 [Epulopiscium sp. SCG-B11WGA-EpuloA1]ONI38421.1 hypothetical protein AN639_07915 [Epulopiscium sp. SCG-B05WGA-EpuloA1]